MTALFPCPEDQHVLAKGSWLVDVSCMAELAGIKEHTYLSRSVWNDVVDLTYHNLVNRSVADRLWDIVLMLKLNLEIAAVNKTNMPEFCFQLAVFKNGISTDVTLKTKALLDIEETVCLVVMLPHEQEKVITITKMN